MADDKLVKMPCQKCGKKIGVRPDQFGRRLRCPACQTAFRIDPPSTAVAKPAPAPRQSAPPPPPPEPEEEVFADEAGELVTAGPPRRATATARFYQPPGVVFEATAFAIRRAGGEVLTLDRANLHVRFAAGANGHATEHTVYVFPGPTGGSELDIRATSVGGRADELLYGRIAAELAAYLEAHHAHALATARPAPLSLPPEPPPPPRRRGRRAESGDGFAIGGLVVSALGMVLFCVPIAAIPLGAVGAVLSLVSLSQRKGNRGLAIAGLALGIMAVVVSGLLFLVLFAGEVQREERRRNRFGAVPHVAPWASVAQTPNQTLHLTPAA